MDLKTPHTIEEVLAYKGIVTYKVIGKSMEPMIFPNIDLVTIKKREPGERFKENDVVLYRKKEKLILHRIVKVLTDNEYILLGDNCSKREYNIKDADILGVLIWFKHNGIRYDVDNGDYLKYVQELRKKEAIRMRKKLLNDIIVRHLEFLPNKFFQKVKIILRKMVEPHTNRI